LKTWFADKTILYDGLQLQPHWIYKNTGLQGNALVAFIGGANVPLDNMVDLEDVVKKAPIYSPKMLHFLGEWFIDSLDQGILLQHHFTSELYESLLEKGIQGLRKRGNDIYFENRKMSVSIATTSGVSVLMHSAVNIETEGTPIPTSGLAELGIDPVPFAHAVLERFTAQWTIWSGARVKVRPRL
jgi:hypothetical protein